METIVAYFSQTEQIKGHPVSIEICNTALKLMAQVAKAKEKTRIAYKDQINRALINIRMYMDVMRPRSFDAPDLTTEIPIQDTTYEFCYKHFE